MTATGGPWWFGCLDGAVLLAGTGCLFPVYPGVCPCTAMHAGLDPAAVRRVLLVGITVLAVILVLRGLDLG